jgi:hypothetical protein
VAACVTREAKNREEVPVNVLIGTPTAGGAVKVQYTHTIANTVRDLTRNGIGVDYLTFDGPDNAIGRDYIASHMLEKGHSHLFFIDSDMWFDGSLCRRMIGFGKPLIGCVYAKRKLDFRIVEQNLGRASHRIDDALALSLDYNVVLPEGPLHVDNGLCRVDAFGMGAVLIQRQVFETMIDKGASTMRRAGAALGLSEPRYDFFCHVPGPDGEMMGEDYSFCLKWREGCSGDVWALVDADVRHVGDMAYGVPFLKRLEALAAAARRTGEPVRS